MMSDKDNNLLKSDILTVGSELSEKLNAIGVPNTFGKASEGKDNLMSIIRMTINGLDMTIDQIREILRDYYNKSEVNTLLNGKSDTSHNHDSAYANISHNHDNAYASKSHQHDGTDVILSNSNDVDTEIVSIEDDITSINGDITSLNNSITNLGNVDTGWVTLSWASNFGTHSTGQDAKVRRVGKIVQLTGWATPKSAMTIDADNPKTIFTLPEQFRPNATLEILCQGSQMAIFLLTINPNGIVQVSRYRSTNSTSSTYPSVSSGAWLPFNATWIVS